MTSDGKIRLVLCWHMHQPDYRDHLRGEFVAPWTYLHAIKDYTDMVAHIEAVPEARAVVNFSPVLLQQLEHLQHGLEAWQTAGKPLPDPLLDMLQTSVFPAAPEARIALLKVCLRAHRLRIIDRFPAYRRLVQMADFVLKDGHGSEYLNDQYLADLVTWYHLGWMGESIRLTDPLVGQLIEQAAGFTLHQRRLLLHAMSAHIGSLRRRYRALAEQGRVELSMSPWGHPMVPLLLDFASAREAMPEVPLPGAAAYPGGEERARWHIEEGLRTAERYFSVRPTGCWPSEGGVSAATLRLLEQAGFGWAATGESVLRNSLRAAGHHDGSIHTPWRLRDGALQLFARDDTLSDLIGFTYSNWHADDAVGDLLHRVEQIGNHHGGADPVVSIIMDGENAWEHYPLNGYYFLSALYRKLAEHPRIRLCTFSELLPHTAPPELPGVVAGSWVHGTFSTWIGDKDKNSAWDILVEAKHSFDAATAEMTDPAVLERLREQLGVCEGSDWFWWLGGYNPAMTVAEFEHLFRVHVAGLYAMLELEPPEHLSQVLSHGEGAPALGGVMRPGTERAPG